MATPLDNHGSHCPPWLRACAHHRPQQLDQARDPTCRAAASLTVSGARRCETDSVPAIRQVPGVVVYAGCANVWRRAGVPSRPLNGQVG